MTSVLQEWVEDIPLMQQTVLLTAVRGPDGLPKEHPSKGLLRYLRRSFLLSAFDKRALLTPDEPGGGSFTGPVHNIEAVLEDYKDRIDEVPLHFHTHLMHAAQILGAKHPETNVALFWKRVYGEFVVLMHLVPEPDDVMDIRMSDDETNWRDAEGGKAPTRMRISRLSDWQDWECPNCGKTKTVLRGVAERNEKEIWHDGCVQSYSGDSDATAAYRAELKHEWSQAGSPLNVGEWR